jgi:DNA-binding NtrC family response regulator
MANILIGDGQPCVRELLSKEMAHEGHRVSCVGDAKSILPVFIFTAYDSFVEDPRLSQADGYMVKSFIALDKLKEKVAEILKWKVAGHKAHESKMVEKANLLHLRPIHSYPISIAQEGQHEL